MRQCSHVNSNLMGILLSVNSILLKIGIQVMGTLVSHTLYILMFQALKF